MELTQEAFDTLAQGVATLKEHVEGMNEGKVDRETVETIAREVLEQGLTENPQLLGRGVAPADVHTQQQLLGAEGDARLHLIQTMPAREVAPLIGRPVDDVVAFQKVSDSVLLLQAILEDRQENPTKVTETRFYKQKFLPYVQAMNTVNAAEGAEFIPRELSPNLIDRVELTQKVLALFPQFDMPTNPFDIPGRPVSRQKLARGVENTADGAGTAVSKRTIASRKVTLTAKKFWGEALVDKEAQEDAIIAMLPYLQDELVRYLRYDTEDAAINGDTAAAQDTQGGFYAADDPLRNWDGLRKLAPAGAKTDAGNVALGVAALRVNRKKMGVYGVDPNELAHVLSINSYIDILSDTAVFTLEKYGPNATILQGELAKVDNVPIIVSEAVHTNLNAVGVVDGVTTNRSEAITVYRNGLGRGQRRGLTVEVLRELYSEWDQDAVKVSTRLALASLFPNTEKIIAIAYNLAS